MSHILIHSNNSALVSYTELFPSQIVFDKTLNDLEDIDLYLDRFIQQHKIAIESSNAIFIKFSLSDNYRELFGLRLGHYIRLCNSLINGSTLPIIFIGDESIVQIFKLSQLGSILATPGIYYIKEDIAKLEAVLKKINDGILTGLKKYDDYINKIQIDPNANYQSHHAIANEWSLIRYFSMFEINNENPAYVSLKEKVDSLHYFKSMHFLFTEKKNTRQSFNPRKHLIDPKIKNISGYNIGLIDDEIEKGWHDFFNYILSSSGATLTSFSDFNKSDSKDDLVANIKAWVDDQSKKNILCDVYIIDLRLHDADFYGNDFDQLSGVIIAEHLKKINPGIQIVMFSASNKIWNLQNCQKIGVEGYAIKESPEYLNDRSDSKQFYQHLKDEIEKTTAKSYLAKLNEIIEDLKANNVFKAAQDVKTTEFRNSVFDRNGLLDQIFNLLMLDEARTIDQCLLLCFQVLERYAEIVSDFGTTNSGGATRIISGFVWTRASSQVHILASTSGLVSTRMELIYGNFPFQKAGSRVTPISFSINPVMQTQTVTVSGIDASTLVRIISVLHFRDNIPKQNIERIMKLRYYRSNVSAHLTGHILDSHKISHVDIIFIFDLLKKLLK